MSAPWGPHAADKGLVLTVFKDDHLEFVDVSTCRFPVRGLPLLAATRLGNEPNTSAVGTDSEGARIFQACPTREQRFWRMLVISSWISCG